MNQTCFVFWAISYVYALNPDFVLLQWSKTL